MSDPAVTAPPARPRVLPCRVGLVLVVYLLIYGGLQVYNCVWKSATYDEPLHLTSGALVVRQHDYRLDPTHPPLLRAWSALALKGQTLPQVDLTGISKMPVNVWTERSYALARQYVFSGGRGDVLIVRGRLMMSVIGLLLGTVIFCWALEWFGFWPATFALGLYTVEPNLMAHSGLITTDAGVVILMFAAVYSLWRCQRRFTALNLAGVAVCTALAIVAKFSGLLLLGLLPVLLVLAVVARTEITSRRAWMIVAVMAVAVVVTIWAAYGFRYSPGPDGEVLIQKASKPAVQAHQPLLADVMIWIDRHHLLPNAFAQGFAWSIASAQALGGYLNGEMSVDGWWYYFPVAFLVKTPLPLLLLSAAGFVLLWRKRERWIDRAFLLLPPAVFLAVAIASRINIGVRHILPLYPYVLLLAAACAGAFWRDGGRLGRVAVALGAAVSAVLFARVWPVTIAFFNELAGGPQNGYRYLSDSNLDWGQHLKALHAWMKREKVDHINLAYFGTVDPASYGIFCTYLPGSPPVARTRPPKLPGYVAISATLQTGGFGVLYRGFLDRTPVAVIGGSIRIYYVEKWPEPPDEDPDQLSATWHRAVAEQLLLETHWFDQAAAHYRIYLRWAPRDSDAWLGLGRSLLAMGQVPEAVDALERGVTFSAQPDKLRERIADLLRRLRHPAEAERFAPAPAAAHVPLLAPAMTGRSH